MKTEKSFCATAYGDVYYWSLGSGPPLLLLHQAGQSSAEFNHVARLLAENFRVVALDYPGHGRSDDPDHELDVAEFCECVMAVVNALEFETLHLCGHHTGGVLSVYLATHHAERISSVVMSGIGIRTEENVRALLDKPMTRDLPVDDKGDFLQKTWQVYRALGSPGTPPDKSFESFVEAMNSRIRPYDAHFAVLDWDREAFMPKMDVPTLLICGEHDHFAESPQALLDKIAGSRFRQIDGGGAFLFVEQPAACAEAITEFIGDLKN